MRERLMLTIVVLALVGTACSSSSTDEPPAEDTVAVETPAGETVAGETAPTATGPTSPATAGETESASGCTESNATDLTGEDVFTVTIKAFAFKPECLMVSSSAGVKVVNKDAAPHSFTTVEPGVNIDVAATDTSTEGPGALTPGTSDFYCTLHPEMQGTIIVV